MDTTALSIYAQDTQLAGRYAAPRVSARPAGKQRHSLGGLENANATMPPRRKKSKITYAEEDEELDEAPPPPPPEEEEDDDGDTGPVDRRASSGSKRSRDEDEEFNQLGDDDDDDEDEDARADAAERRLAGRIAREDAEDTSSAGSIKEIH